MSKKRSREEEILHYEKKIQKLEEKIPGPKSTSVTFAGEYRDRESTARSEVTYRRDSRDVSSSVRRTDSRSRAYISPAPDTRQPRDIPATSIQPDNISSTELRSPRDISSARVPKKTQNKDPRNMALLNALDDNLSLCGEKINANLAKKWTNILRKGLPIDMKDKLLKEYAAPDNCRLLKSPTLNVEIDTISGLSSKNQDKILEGKQHQLGLGISAIGKGITVLLNQGTNYEVNAMRHFNHGCRLLLDLHFKETCSRRHLFKDELCRSEVFGNLKIDELKRDDTLFGNKVARMAKNHGKKEKDKES